MESMYRRLLGCWDRDGFGWWVARNRTDGRFAGRGGLRRMRVLDRDEIELGYGFVPEFWGRGMATELATASVQVGFGFLGAKEIVTFTLPTNLASRRVMQKAGFQYDRDFEYLKLPHVLYRLQREHWERKERELDSIPETRSVYAEVEPTGALQVSG